jgi:hypothetical protein
MISATSAQTTLFEALSPPDEQADKKVASNTNIVVVDVFFTSAPLN